MPAETIISIICCTHNRRAFVEKHFQALRHELTDQIELIYALDNCSDDTITYLQKNAISLPNVRLLDYRGPGGLFNCRNFSLDDANGRFIHFLDDDDSVDPGYHRTLCKRLENENDAGLDAYVTGMMIEMDDGSKTRQQILSAAGQARARKQGEEFHLHGDLFAHLLDGDIYFNCANTLFSKYFFQQHRFHGEILKSADWLLYLEAALAQSLHFVVNDSICANYFVHQNSMSLAPDKSNWNAKIFDKLFCQTPADSIYFSKVKECCALANFHAGYANRIDAKFKAFDFYVRAIHLGLVHRSLFAIAKLPFQH